MPIAIFTDIDGTLINSDRRVTPETQKALQTCVENGAMRSVEAIHEEIYAAVSAVVK